MPTITTFLSPHQVCHHGSTRSKGFFHHLFSFLGSIPDHEKNCFVWQKQTHMKDCCCLVKAIRNNDNKDLLATYFAISCYCLVIHRHPSCSKSFKAELFQVVEQGPMPSQSQATNPSICVLQAQKIFLNYARRLGTWSVLSHKYMV